MTGYRIERLRAEQAYAILDWRYPAPYDFYDAPQVADAAEYVSQFLDPSLAFHAVLGNDGEFVGFCSFGRDGQVPGGDYATEALDIGLGMRPELTGRGLGKGFFESILRFAAGNFGAGRYRVTVANFNERALRLYHGFGFEKCAEFEDPGCCVAYSILMRDDRK